MQTSRCCLWTGSCITHIQSVFSKSWLLCLFHTCPPEDVRSIESGLSPEFVFHTRTNPAGVSLLRQVHNNTELLSVQVRDDKTCRGRMLYITSAKEIRCFCLQHINTDISPYDQKLSTTLCESSTCVAPHFHPDIYSLFLFFPFLCLSSVIKKHHQLAQGESSGGSLAVFPHHLIWTLSRVFTRVLAWETPEKWRFSLGRRVLTYSPSR